ncbi:hypothetical protein MMC34_002867 [Xylographa carneopallida]|nr:hypothetical protein [Xylographa carneopallida]
MSTYSSLSGDGRPQLVLRPKSSGWGWPRLVDIPKAPTPPPIRASSVKSHSGAIYTAERDLVDTKIRKRASSLKSHISSIPDTERGSQSPRSMSPVANKTDANPQAPLELSESKELESPKPPKIWDCDVESCEAPSVTEAPTESPFKTSDEPKDISGDRSTSSGRKRSTPFVISLIAEISRSQTLAEQAVPPSNSDSLSKSSPTVVPSTPPEETQEVYTSTELFSHPSPAVLPVPQSTPLPEAGSGSYFEQELSTSQITHPLLHSESSTSPIASEHSGSSEEAPRKSHFFRKIPSDESPIADGASATPNSGSKATVSKTPAPIDVTKLPPPKILIIRATEDSTEDSAAIPVAPDLFENVGLVPKDITKDTIAAILSSPSYGTNVPHLSQSDIDLPSVPHVSTGLINNELGAVDAVEIPVAPKADRVKKSRTMVRKTRKVVLRSPVLTIILGRQLALMTRPALKVIAKGGDLAPVAALGNEVEMLGAL